MKKFIAVICDDRRWFDQFLRDNRFERETEERKFVQVSNRENAFGMHFHGFYEHWPYFPKSREAKSEVLIRMIQTQAFENIDNPLPYAETSESLSADVPELQTGLRNEADAVL